MSDSPPLPPADWPVMEPGWVWLCGAGPGDPGLMSLHALNALRQAEVIVHDALVAPHILGWARPGAELVDVGKRGGRPSPKQHEISLQLVELARAGKRVLRLKGGDPFMFGRGSEEARTLVRHRVPFRVIPGITAGIGGLAMAGIPVTDRDVNQAVTFVTGHDPSGDTPPLDWAALARASPVIVIYMGMRTISRIAEALIGAGRAPGEPVAVVRNASLPDQQVLETTLARAAADIAAAGLSAPAVIVIGRAVLLRQALEWPAMAAGQPAHTPEPPGPGRPAEAP